MPPVVEKRIRQLLNQYSYNITSVLTQFPSQKIANVIDRWDDALDRNVLKYRITGCPGQKFTKVLFNNICT